MSWASNIFLEQQKSSGQSNYIIFRHLQYITHAEDVAHSMRTNTRKRPAANALVRLNAGA